MVYVRTWETPGLNWYYPDPLRTSCVDCGCRFLNAFVEVSQGDTRSPTCCETARNMKVAEGDTLCIRLCHRPQSATETFRITEPLPPITAAVIDTTSQAKYPEIMTIETHETIATPPATASTAAIEKAEMDKENVLRMKRITAARAKLAALIEEHVDVLMLADDMVLIAQEALDNAVAEREALEIF